MHPLSPLPIHNDTAYSEDALGQVSRMLLNMKEALRQQFHKLEEDFLSRAEQGAEKYATKEDLYHVLQKLQEFKNEMERLIAHATDPSVRTPPVHEKEEDIFSNLTPFNLRRKYHTFSLRLRSEEVDPFGYDPIFDQFIRPLMDFMYTKYWRVETHGIQNVPASGGCLLVGNHSGGLPYDATMLKMALYKEHPAHRGVRFMVEDFLFHFPFLGSFMNRLGGVRASPDNAQELLAHNHPVVVFPEGVKGLGKLYRNRYQLARFGRGGFVRLCLKTRAPMVPVAFIGPEEIHPMIAKETFFSQMLGVPYTPITWTFPWLGPLGLLPLPSKWSIHLLEPIDFSNYGEGAEKDRVLVYKMAKMIKEQIQDTIVDALKKRRSIWF